MVCLYPTQNWTLFSNCSFSDAEVNTNPEGKQGLCGI